MNNLTLLIILADVLPSLATAVAVISCILAMLLGLMLGLGVTGFCGDEADGHRYAVDIAPRFRKLKPWVIGCIVVFVLSHAVPSNSNTYYAIAASEIGEEIVKSETAGKAMKALDNWLDSQLQTEENENADD